MTPTVILNLILAIGVIVMVVAPLAWAILTQHRDQPRLAAAESPAARPFRSRERRRGDHSKYKPLTERV